MTKPEPRSLAARMAAFLREDGFLEEEGLLETKAGEGTHPQRIDAFVIERELGRGGAGVVFAARDSETGQRVALKLLGAKVASRAGIERFRREIRTVAKLRHPGIVGLLQHGLYQGCPYYAMELVEGGSLAEHLERAGPLEPRAVARLAERLARALSYAHGQGILHRDVKPGNVLLDVDGAPRLADFGLARTIDAASKITVTGALLGTPAYMAPEQARGERVDARADVYALGATLYHALIGRPPFIGPNREATRHALLHGTLVAPRALRSRVPRDLETICLACLEREPGRRYATALDLAEDLERWQGGHPIRARRTTRAERLVLWARREPLRALAVCGLLVSLAVATGLARLAAEQTRRLERTQAERAETSRRLEETRAERAAEEAGRLRQRYRRLQEAARWPEAAVIIGKLLEQDPRPEDVRALGKVSSAWWSGRALAGHSWTILAAAWSPDGSRYATAGFDGSVCVWRGELTETRHLRACPSHLGWSRQGLLAVLERTDYRTGRGRISVWRGDGASDPHLLGAPAQVVSGPQAMEWSPKAEKLAAILTSGVAVYDLETGDGPWPTVPDLCLDSEVAGEGSFQRVTWSRCGRRLAVGSTTGQVWVWDLEQPTRPPLRGALHESPVRTLRWSEGGGLAGGAEDGSVSIWHPGSGKPPRRLAAHAQEVDWLSWSPDGQLLASSSLDGKVRVWLPSGEPLVTFAGLGQVSALKWSPDTERRRLACANRAGFVKVWELDRSEQPIATLSTGGRRVREVDWSPDGTALLAVAGTLVFLWRADPLPRVVDLATGSASPEVFAWSPRERRLAFVGPGGELKLWTAGGDDPVTLARPRGRLTALAWSEDAAWLASGCRTGELWVTRPGDSASPRRLLHAGGGVMALAWGDATELACAAHDGTLTIFKGLETDRPAWVLDPRTVPGGRELLGPPVSVGWSGEGRLAARWGDGALVVWRPTTGQALVLPGRPAADRRVAQGLAAPAEPIQTRWPWRGAAGHRDVAGMAWEPGGERIAVASDEHGVVVWDLSAAPPVGWWPDEGTADLPGVGAAVAWGRAGLANALSSSPTIHLWDMAATPRLRSAFRRERSWWSYQNSLSLSGRKLACAGNDGQVEFYALPAGAEPQQSGVLRSQAAPTWRAAWSHDASLVASGSHDRLVVWDAKLADPALRREAIAGVTGLELAGDEVLPRVESPQDLASFRAGNPEPESAGPPQTHRLKDWGEWRAVAPSAGRGCRVKSLGACLRVTAVDGTGRDFSSEWIKAGASAVVPPPETSEWFLRIERQGGAVPLAPCDYRLEVGVPVEPAPGEQPEPTPAPEPAQRVGAYLVSSTSLQLLRGDVEGSADSLQRIGEQILQPGTIERRHSASYELTLGEDETIYLVAWDLDDDQFVVGLFEGLPWGTVGTNADDWEVLVASGPNPGGRGPSSTELSREIQAGRFSRPHAVGPAERWITPNEELWIEGRAQALWADTFRARTPTDDHYVVFRLRTAGLRPPSAPAGHDAAAVRGGERTNDRRDRR